MKEREIVTKIRRYWKQRGPLDLALGGPIVRHTLDFLEKRDQSKALKKRTQ